MCVVIIGLMKSGRAVWQEEDETRKKISIALILLEKFCTSELSKVIQDAILLILHFRTLSWFRTVSSSTLITLDVQSIYIPSSILDWYLEVKFWAIDRQYSFCLWILWTRNTRILRRSTWKHRVMHNTCIKQGNDLRTQCIGSTSILLWRKDWSSVRHDRTQLSFMKHFQLVVFRKLLGWQLERSHLRESLKNDIDSLRRFPWNMIGWRNWVQKLLDKQKSTNQPNQTQIQFMIERGNPLWQKTRPVRVLRKSIHVSLVTARTPI